MKQFNHQLATSGRHSWYNVSAGTHGKLGWFRCLPPFLRRRSDRGPVLTASHQAGVTSRAFLGRGALLLLLPLLLTTMSTSDWQRSSPGEYSSMYVPDPAPVSPNDGQYSQTGLYGGANTQSPTTYMPTHDEFQFISSSEVKSEHRHVDLTRIQVNRSRPNWITGPGPKSGPAGKSESRGPENGVSRWRRPNSDIYSQNHHFGLVYDMIY